MVYVFPELVAPYVNSSWFWPSRKSLILGITISWKSADCSVSGGKILLNAYLR